MSTPQENGPTSQEIVDQLFGYAAEAARANEPERIELVDRALTLACNYLTRLNYRIEGYVEAALKQSGLNPEGTAISLIELARSHDELDMFRNQEALGDFLDALGENMVKRGNIDEDRMKELKRITLNSYDKMAEQSVEKSELIKNFLIIKGVCCSPPDSPDSGEPDPGPVSPRPAGFWKVTDKAIDILAKLAGIAGLILALHQLPHKPEPDAVPPPPPHPQTPLIVKMLILLMLSVAANEALGLDALPPGMRRIIGGGRDAEDAVEQLKQFLQRVAAGKAKEYA